MILVELRLENYKQFAGEHLIEFPPEGAVAIMGNNGVGKTTLFEAIEWCLYNPRQIPNDDLPPRGGVGDTRVSLVLEDPRDQARYVIERTRRRRGVDAEVYRQDELGLPIVKGTRDVTDYVAHRLIGLSHRAFVSTFFTRQKELSFFGDLRDTERRREVAQLLGYETIRTAQSIIGDDRTEARNDYQALERQYQDESKDRDLAAEFTAAETAIVAAAEAERQAILRREQSEAAHQQARAELERWAGLERRHAALSQEFERLTGELTTAQANQRNAETHLGRLATLERNRRELLPQVDAEPLLRERVTIHEKEQARFHQCQTLAETVVRATRTVADTCRRAESLVRAINPNGLQIDGWTWTETDPHHLEPAIARLLGAIDRLDPAEESRRAEALRALVEALALRDEARDKAGRYRAHLAVVEAEREDLLKVGDPRSEISAIATRREATQQAAQTATVTARECAARRQDLLQTVSAIRAAARAPECPTCHRPLSPRDAAIAIAPLDAQIQDLAARIDAAHRAKRTADEQLAQLESELATAQAKLTSLQELDRRHARGSGLVADATADAEQREQACSRQLAVLERAIEPTRQEATALAHRADTVKTIFSQRPGLLHLSAQLAEATAAHAQATNGLQALGPVDYDPEAHRQAVQSLTAARAATARLAQIDEELARRADYQAQLATAAEAGARVTELLAATQVTRDELRFDRAALEQSERDERDALARAREAERAVATAQRQLATAIRDRDDIIAQRERLATLARRAETRRREHDELDRMYREFSRFDQYVAQLVTPQLADYTGELLAEVTDHKYDQVVFDENYGVRIFDGPEDFPIDQFSGGERDVAALCARLALSRFIGAQAAHPPRFLVLDEVFGSLDADRRAQVMAALLKLAGADGPFRQLFIISHVDDIRLSAALDEIWRVREVDGASTVENLSRSGIVDEV